MDLMCTQHADELKAAEEMWADKMSVQTKERQAKHDSELREKENQYSSKLNTEQCKWESASQQFIERISRLESSLQESVSKSNNLVAKNKSMEESLIETQRALSRKTSQMEDALCDLQKVHHTTITVFCVLCSESESVVAFCLRLGKNMY